MNSQVTIPQGEQKVTVELTVKQAMALTGLRFNQNPDLAADARRQLKKSLERTLLHSDNNKVHYHELNL
ncbi:hypothetical protein MJA45_22435 [Paenibacillus aurantius]|uniref:Uncharacterized protein n=1 Tax=Paenibacillus aurantius TaxID=2918900 RepID=A0AA96LEW8_9BACL|nr:hypothetical protein [Paenibacillus aurantius]WJH35093.1 hypothetical protein N6H14_02965 [Paenibacillus sp. CC-CFT747]WNQ10352.1 hypothetical protein MJA45_22435 [Paenibacillus aurantius]